MNMFVADVLSANPAAAQVFIRRGMGCVGCAFVRFETVAEVAAAYGVDACALATALRETWAEHTGRT
jgi:hybrid cluster-associated redox disulfide protein